MSDQQLHDAAFIVGYFGFLLAIAVPVLAWAFNKRQWATLALTGTITASLVLKFFIDRG